MQLRRWLLFPRKSLHIAGRSKRFSFFWVRTRYTNMDLLWTHPKTGGRVIWRVMCIINVSCWFKPANFELFTQSIQFTIICLTRFMLRRGYGVSLPIVFSPRVWQRATWQIATSSNAHETSDVPFSPRYFTLRPLIPPGFNFPLPLVQPPLENIIYSTSPPPTSTIDESMNLHIHWFTNSGFKTFTNLIGSWTNHWIRIVHK